MVVSLIQLSANGAQVAWAILGMLRYIAGVPWVVRDHYLQCIELGNVLAVFGCGLASFVVEVASAASHSVFGGDGRMIHLLQVVCTAWAPGSAYTPSLL